MNATNSKPTLTLLADLVGELKTDAEAAFEASRSGLPRGPVTGMAGLDDALGGYLQPGLHILQAAPGVGKTAFALQIASSCGFPALYISAEMPILELFRRLIARETQTFLGRLKSGELSPDKIEALALATARRLPHLAILDAQRDHAEPTVIRDAADGLRARLNAAQCLIVIDSLHVWAMSGKGATAGAPMSEYDALNAALTAAAQIAADVASPLLLIAHRNRAGQDKGGLHTAKGTGSIEYLAETVIELGVPDGATWDGNGEKAVAALIHKNRNGHAGAATGMRFSGRLQQFREDGAAAAVGSGAVLGRRSGRSTP